MKTSVPSHYAPGQSAWFPGLGELLLLAQDALGDNTAFEHLYVRIANFSRETLTDAWDYVVTFSNPTPGVFLNEKLMTPAGRLIREVLRSVSCHPNYFPQRRIEVLARVAAPTN